MAENLIWANVMRPRIPLVYLDLHVIIRMARASRGGTDVPAEYLHLREEALRAKWEERAMFPLSGEHLWEVARITDPQQRGNGRMARALQTLVMARDRVLEPTFSSIEEWLGANTEDYYRVLALTGGRRWNPGNDAGLWVKFNLRAHHMQAQTLQRRFREAEATWSVIDALIAEHGLPERVGDPLFDAILGYRVRRPGYVKRAGIEERTATRDLNQLVNAGLLDAVGQTRGRYDTASQRLRRIAVDTRSDRSALIDPYPWLPARLRARTT